LEAALLKTDSNPRASDAIVPTTPSVVQICRYFNGLAHTANGRRHPKAVQGHLRGERVLTHLSLVESLAEEFDALQPVPEGPIYDCPASTGGPLYAVFAYANGEPPVTVRVDLSGCPFVTNGKSGQAFWGSSDLLNRLRSLTKSPG
jgi:hypothetical protein